MFYSYSAPKIKPFSYFR